MKKIFGTPLLALAAIIIGTAAVLAYTVSSFTFGFDVEEAIEIGQISCQNAKVMPGETYSCAATLKNKSGQASYGMQYNGNIYSGTWIYELTAQTQKENGVLSLDKPVQSKGSADMPITLPPPLGKLWFYVDRDGPGPEKLQPYNPGQTINLTPNGIHWVEIKVQPSYSIAPGELKADFKIDRGEPAPETLSKPK